MRQIRFRGKTKAGKWVYGSLLICAYGHFIIPLDVDMFKDNHNEWSSLDEIHEVIDETVGQFTGIKDLNGKGIYEGDILHYSLGLDEPKIHVVFDTEGGRWHRNYDYSYSEIIGNIHDNPELLNPKS